MKRFLVSFALIVITGCTNKKPTNSELVTAYYAGFENSNYDQIKKTIADSLTIISGDYTMPFTQESFYEQFKWDSVFKPIYKVVKIEDQHEQVITTVSIHSLKLDFLKNNPLTCKHKFLFKSGKIHKIEELDCIDANWEIWQQERDTLVNWIKINHPELDGFIHDLSMQGAINYVNAIKLYRKRKTKPFE